ncbi:MAG: hypothetical protein E7604_04785 [Ruminococcaceae bacterium]|nr:hypothetical protein [Oscillospiraceae bacterium]
MKTQNRILALLLSLILLISCFGCNRSPDTVDAERRPSLPTGVWDMSDPLTLPDDLLAGNGRGFSRDSQGNLCMTASPNRFSAETRLIRFAPDGTLTASPYPDGDIMKQPAYQYADQRGFACLPDGGFASIIDQGQTDMLIITDGHNRVTAEAEIPYFGSIGIVDDIIYAPAQDTIYAGSQDGFAAFTTDGVLLWTWKPSYPIIGLSVSRDGTGYVCAYDLLTDISVISVRPLDNTAKCPGEPYLLPEAVNLMNADLVDHPSFDVCWNAGDAVWGCDFLPDGTDPKTVMPTEIINLLNSDISAQTVTDLIFLSDDEALLYSSDYRANLADAEPYYARLSRVPEEALTPVFEITVAACGAGTYHEYARAFNASQDEFRVVFRSYDTYGLDDAQKPRTAFETDLITGNIPDIILGNGFFILDDYVHLGIFADIYTFLDADPTFGRDDLHACVLTPFEAEDGTLPYLVDTFYISTVEATAASAKHIPDDWTFADAEELAAAMPSDGMLFYVSGDNGSALLERLLPVTVTGLFENGKTDREALSALLSFCRNYQTSKSLSSDERGQMLTDGNILTTLQTHMQTPYRLLDSRWGTGHGEAPVYVGFPSAAGNGSAVSMREGFAITTKAAGHELASRGAWAFIRYVLENKTYDTQGTAISYFGAAKVSLERMFDSAETVYCLHYDPSRTSLAYYGQPHQHSENEPEPNIVTFDENDRAAIRDLIAGITVRADAYPMVCDMIYEEASAYFADAKSLEETVSVIASRAELYFAERG